MIAKFIIATLVFRAVSAGTAVTPVGDFMCVVGKFFG
jgi:hypothetical protein